MKEQNGPIKEQLGLVSDGQPNAKHFGNYDLVRRIDVGGMGEVYLARQRTAFGREVAVKIIRSDLVHDITARKRFLREAEVSAHLKHEHILPLVEFGEEQGRLFLVTPYIQGGTLVRRLQSGPLSLAEVQRLFPALVQAVAYIHRRGVVHRDLKPSNILLDREEDSEQVYVRLIDFGIASIQGTSASAPLTSAGHEMGTLAYMAPERVDGIAAPSNDIYSLGVMLYQMLTGQLPGTGTIKLPQPLEYVVRRCIVPNPDDRFASADELLRAFDQACQSLNTEPPSQSVATQAEIVPDPEEEIPTRSTTSPRSPFASRPLERRTQTPESELSPRASMIRQSQSSPEHTFAGEDYNAPTSYISPQYLQGKQLADVAVITKTPALPRRSKGRGRKISALAIIPLSIAVVLVLLIGLILFAFQAALAANITISPQVHAISKAFTITAKPGLHTIDLPSASIPANVLTSNKTGSQQGPTTGVAQCLLGIFDCKQAVSFVDVLSLSALLKPSIRVQINQDLQRQEQASGAVPVGNVFYTDVNVSANPAVGTVSKTVTVSLTEQGSVEYLNMKDVRSLALLMLQQQMSQQLGPNYGLISALTQVGQPKIQNVGLDGTVKILVAAGGIARYQIPTTELRAIQNGIKGMKQSVARTLIATRPGLDATMITIHISYGDTLPSDPQQITVVSVNAANLPPVQLPQI